MQRSLTIEVPADDFAELLKKGLVVRYIMIKDVGAKMDYCYFEMIACPEAVVGLNNLMTVIGRIHMYDNDISSDLPTVSFVDGQTAARELLNGRLMDWAEKGRKQISQSLWLQKKPFVGIIVSMKEGQILEQTQQEAFREYVPFQMMHAILLERLRTHSLQFEQAIKVQPDLRTKCETLKRVVKQFASFTSQSYRALGSAFVCS